RTTTSTRETQTNQTQITGRTIYTTADDSQTVVAGDDEQYSIIDGKSTTTTTSTNTLVNQVLAEASGKLVALGVGGAGTDVGRQTQTGGGTLFTGKYELFNTSTSTGGSVQTTTDQQSTVVEVGTSTGTGSETDEGDRKQGNFRIAQRGTTTPTVTET